MGALWNSLSILMRKKNKHPFHELAVMCKLRNESAKQASESGIITVLNSIEKRECSPEFVTYLLHKFPIQEHGELMSKRMSDRLCTTKQGLVNCLK